MDGLMPLLAALRALYEAQQTIDALRARLAELEAQRAADDA